MLEEVIDDLRRSHCLEQGKDNVWYGQVHGQATILLPVAIESVCFMVKIRLGRVVCEKQDLSNDLDADGDGNLELTLENEYAWLIINDVSKLNDISDVNLWILTAIELLRQRNLLTEQSCHLCGQTGATTLMYDDLRDVARACHSCQTERLQIRDEKAEAARRWRPVKFLFVLLAALVSAAGWVLVWSAYDFAFKLVGRDTVVVPEVLLGIFAVAAAVAVAGPLTWKVRSSSLAGNLPGRMIAIAMLLFALVTGEIAYWTLLIYREFGNFAPATVARNILVLLQTCDDMYLVLKGAIAIVAIIIVWVASKKRQNRESLLDLKAKA